MSESEHKYSDGRAVQVNDLVRHGNAFFLVTEIYGAAEQWVLDMGYPHGFVGLTGVNSSSIVDDPESDVDLELICRCTGEDLNGLLSNRQECGGATRIEKHSLSVLLDRFGKGSGMP